MTNFGLCQTERVCRRQFQMGWKWQKVLQTARKHWEKEKFLVTSNFFFSHSVFKRLVLQTRKNQGLFGTGLTDGLRMADSGLCNSELFYVFSFLLYIQIETKLLLF